MIFHDALFWARFRNWHVRTEHRWDMVLHMEALILSIDGLSRTMGEALLGAAKELQSIVNLSWALAR